MRIFIQKISNKMNHSLKFIQYSTLITLLAVSLSSCEDVFQLDIPKNDPYLVVDATITNVAGEQSIKLSKSQALMSNH